MFNKVLVHVKRKVFDYYLTAATLCFTCVVLHGADGQCAAHVYGVCTLATIHALANDNNIRGCTSTTECLVVHAESTDNICASLIYQPCTELCGVRAVKCSA